jgi:hypothetical protein
MPEIVEGFLRVEDEATALLGLYNDVVNVDLQIMPDLFLKTGLHTPLVGGPCILQNERHFYVAKAPEWSNEWGGGLVCLGEGYLVVAQVGS